MIKIWKNARSKGIFVLNFFVKLKQNTLLKEKSNLVSDENELATIFITKDLEQKKDSKGKLNNLEDVLKAFEFRQVLKKSTNLSTLQKSSVFAM